MRGRIFVIGMLLALASVAATLLLQNSEWNTQNFTLTRITVGIGSINAVPIRLNQTGIVQLRFTSALPIDLYLMNSSAYSKLSGKSVTAYNFSAVGLEGLGVFGVYRSASSGAYPIAGSGDNVPLYLPPFSWSSASYMKNDTYYAVFVNIGNPDTHVNLFLAQQSRTQIQNKIAAYSPYYTAANLASLLGVALILYGFFSKERRQIQQQVPVAEESPPKETSRQNY